MGAPPGLLGAPPYNVICRYVMKCMVVTHPRDLDSPKEELRSAVFPINGNDMFVRM